MELEGRIKTYLQAKLPQAEGPEIGRVERMSGGNSRETLAIDARWREKGADVARSFVFRRELTGSVLETTSDHEYNVIRCLMPSAVPVPEVYWLETDGKWLDRPFFVMEKVVGDPPARLAGDPEERTRILHAFIKSMGDLHNADWGKLGLSFLGVPRNAEECAGMPIAKWRDIYDRTAIEPEPIVVELLQWLDRNKPKKVERVSVIHGDPGPGNFISKDGKVLAIHDWEMSHLGDPMDDVGWICWRGGMFGSGKEEILRLYEHYSAIKVNQESVFYWEVFANVKAATACLTGGAAFCTGANRMLNMAQVGLGGSRRFLQRAAEMVGF
ncbi:MAG: phosphotransferase family protein [Chloroflexi bacterium]|nr:phosphotransferase family protein [Chloroflexota bacterium]